MAIIFGLCGAYRSSTVPDFALVATVLVFCVMAGELIRTPTRTPSATWYFA